MKTKRYTNVRRSVDHAVGSMAIDGIFVSHEIKSEMLRIASGKTNATKVKQKLVEPYGQT